MRKKVISKEIKELIKFDYLSGMTVWGLYEKYGYSDYLIKNILQEYGIVLEKYNKIKTDEMIKLIDSGMSINKAAKELGVHRSCILQRFKKQGIKVENFQNSLRFNENIFDKIDSEEKAYWLGFIYADGYISNRDNNKKYGFELSLALKDFNHLEKFNKFISNKAIVKCDSYRCRVMFSNKHVWNTLNNYGCTPNKSLTLKFPDKNIFSNENLIIHFIRGYFDGDGCICSTKTVKLLINILGTKDFLMDFQKNIDIYSTIAAKDKRSKVFSFNFSVIKGERFIEKIYDNATIYLDRKYEKYLWYFEKYGKTYKQVGKAKGVLNKCNR